MRANFAVSLKDLLAPDREGGFSNDPDDSGGMTNLGVTRAVWQEWVGHPVSEKEMRELTPVKVASLYKAKYWDKVKGDDLPSGIDYCVFDAAVNSGPGRAIKWLQACVGVEVDGGIGPKTLDAVAKADRATLLNDYAKRRLSFMMDHPKWDKYKGGWTKRVSQVQAASETMTA